MCSTKAHAPACAARSRRCAGRSGPKQIGTSLATRERAGLTDHVETDVAEFDRLRRADRLEEAFELWRGDLLSGLDDDWVLVARDEWRQRVGGVLGELATRAQNRRGPARRSRPHPPDRRARPAQRGGSARAHVPARGDRGSRRGARRVQPVCRSAPRRAPDRAIADHESAGRRTARLRCRGQVGGSGACGLDRRADLGGGDSDALVYRSRRLDRAARRSR